MISHYKVLYTAEAKTDLKAIYCYIAFELLALNSAKLTIDNIRNRIRGLETMPLRYPIMEDPPIMHIRKMTVANYVVFFIVESTSATVKILRIFYSGRNIDDIFRNDFLN